MIYGRKHYVLRPHRACKISSGLFGVGCREGVGCQDVPDNVGTTAAAEAPLAAGRCMTTEMPRQQGAERRRGY